MTTAPRISVIMATYNCSDTVERSIESILKQSYTSWEFIICDDCSSDGTYDILKKYESKYKGKIIVLRNEINSKLSFSLNRCLEIAKGEYIARMDGDDESLPERFRKQIDFLDTHPEYDVTGCAMIPFDENGERPPRLAILEPSPVDMIHRSPFFHATILMRKSAYDKVGGYTVSKRTMRAQDYDMWFRFFKEGMKGYNLQDALYKVLEDDKAYKRRSFKTRAYEVLTKLKGYSMLNFPLYTYIYAFKPLIVAIIPNSIMKKYHSKRDENKI